ncbi:ABC transporter permease [Bosea sp. (in: a-proteobacteria)]|uniref:ABC transporter permease n=1 Tax=Bosea sp. (in: a-proteobacteria) TaxID=1871050 RepID=UPI0026290D5A|nr:ABC transporter permease [Bosea sp. (in: a-proteobacteria)]MCO5092176.1 ABC transporter permease [Bosea sp. (in: a-proteobacteria)]
MALDSSAVAKRNKSRSRAWRPEIGALPSLLLVLPFAAMLAFFVVYPFIRLTQIAVFSEGALQNLVDFFSDSSNLVVLRTTYVISAIVTVLAILFGGVLAWTLKTTRSATVRFIILASVLVPFWMGTMIKLYAWTVILQTNGLVNNFLVATGILSDKTRLALLYNELAVVIGMVSQMLPFAVLPLVVAFSSIDLDIVRAAEGLGAARLRAIVSIVIPLAIPGILATTMLVFVLSTGFFLTPVILGGITSPFTASLIYQNVFTFFDLNAAAITALVLVVSASIVILLAFKIVGADRIRKALG